MSDSAAPTPRAQPFYCPYCGEEDFAPAGADAGGFHCESCDRYYVIRFVGVGSGMTHGNVSGEEVF